MGTATYEFETLASGLQGIWSRENTRESLWDAMQRKETYATTGTRMTVRLFAGWDYDEADVQRPDFASTGYLGGVPMGGDLTARPLRVKHLATHGPRNARPRWRQPGPNANYQGLAGQKRASYRNRFTMWPVRMIARSAPTKRCERVVGSTVNVDSASYNNSIGDVMQVAYWEDPDFDPKESAFYYVRVLEIPTPRWTTHDAAFFGVERPSGVPAQQQERAYTSPIWYTP